MGSEQFERGLLLRKELVGDEYVEQALGDPGDFAYPMQELATEYCWGAIWTRQGLDRRSRSILNLGMLAALDRPEEFAGHVKVALANGLTRAEIQECLLQVAVYCGIPAGVAAFRIARRVLDEIDNSRDETE